MFKRSCQYQFARSGREQCRILLRTVIFMLCLSVLPTIASADSSTGIYFEVMPPNPTTADEIRIKTHFYGWPFIVTHLHSVIGNQITVTLFMDGGDYSPNPPHDFTEYIGKLPPGEYQVTVLVKWDPSNPEIFETLYGTFVVTQAVTVPTLNEYGLLILSLLLAGISLYFLRRNWRVLCI